MTDDDYDALSQKHLASIKRDMRISLNNAVVRATHKVMIGLIEEAVKAERVKEAPKETSMKVTKDYTRRDGVRTVNVQLAVGEKLKKNT